jgi:hypothetical protein
MLLIKIITKKLTYDNKITKIYDDVNVRKWEYIYIYIYIYKLASKLKCIKCMNFFGIMCRVFINHDHGLLLMYKFFLLISAWLLAAKHVHLLVRCLNLITPADKSKGIKQ